jgi:DNA polymerase-3 subunit delta'
LSFNDIIGHEQIKENIINSIRENKLSHAHIFSGEKGIGKSLLARELAVQVLGGKQDKEYVDIVQYSIPLNKKSIGVDNIREIIEEVNKKPYEGNKKIIIINNAAEMTEAAQNAFLKTIEEPPKGVFIILLCENLENILDTIKSRCQIHKLQRLSGIEMKSFINKKLNIFDEKKIKVIISFSDGIPGRAESFINDEQLSEIRERCLIILKGINEESAEDFLKNDLFLVKFKDKWQEVLTCLVSYIRDILVYKDTSSEELIINIDKINEIKNLSENFSFNKLNGIVNIINESREKIERNVNTALIFDSLLIKMQEV